MEDTHFHFLLGCRSNHRQKYYGKRLSLQFRAADGSIYFVKFKLPLALPFYPGIILAMCQLKGLESQIFCDEQIDRCMTQQ